MITALFRTRLLAMVVLGMLVASGPAFAQTDYDTDNDNYIDVSTHAQLNAIRWDLNGDGAVAATDTTNYNAAFPNAASGMGCASTCTGYELTANIDLDTDGGGSANSADAYWNSGDGWLPIGNDTNKYTGDFKGNGYTIDNLFINRSSGGYQALFGAIGTTSRLESLGVTNANVTATAQDYIGILVGHTNGDIVACYATGAVSGRYYVGGLAGYMGATGTPAINSSYSTASVSGGANVGGLLGRINLGSVTNSYSTGRISAPFSFGGLIGIRTGSNVAQISVTSSYWDLQTSMDSSSPGGGSGQTTNALQSPTGYTGIYANWNVDVDSDRVPDNPWNFGTTSQYPTLRTPTQRVVDHDSDNNGLIDVTSLLQLNAIRYDLNGDGLPTGTNADTIAYANAFPGGDITASSGRMGCPATGGCTGYELMNNLDFDENNDDQITSADATYWNSGAGWTPIGVASTGAATVFSATFDGNDNTISNLFIADSTSTATGGGFVGLFGDVSGTIRDVGLLDVNITNTRTSTASSNNFGRTGALAGRLSGGAVRGSYVAGGSVTHNTSSTSNGTAGCLLGYASAPVSDSYATCNVSGTNNGALSAGGLIGETTGTVDSTYATGTVTVTGTGIAAFGGLTGTAWGRVSVSYATGNVTATGLGRVGGLIGRILGPSYANYATGNVSGSGTGNGSTNALSLRVGGLMGEVNLSGSEYLRSSYATGTVSGSGSGVRAGGLIGQVQVTDANSISAVYAIGAVSNTATGTTFTGGLAGLQTGSATPMTNSYWDTQTSGQSTTAGTSSFFAGAQTTSALQSITGYTTGSIYANWNQNLDGQTGNDDPWYFGATNQYPVLKYAGLDTTAQLALQPSIPAGVAVTSNGDTLYVGWRAASQATGYTVQWKSGVQSYAAAREATTTATRYKIPLTSGTTYTVRVIASKTGVRDGISGEVMRAPGLTNYDTDGDGLIAITTLAQLNAIRWDLNGDGAIDAFATTADTTAYNTAFPSRDTATRMGCLSGCTGYELLADLDFDENNDGEITATDATYWNSGAGWNPTGTYTGTFQGNNNTISHLFIDRGTRHNAGLFQSVEGNVSGLGLLNVDVTGNDRVGALAGAQGGGSTISSCYVTGSVSGSKWGVGGLIGQSYRTSGTNRIVSSYANVSVSVPATVTSDGKVGGLVGWLRIQTEVVASYALGPVFVGHSSGVGGGLVGELASGSGVTASYSIGRVTGAGTTGGLVGTSAGSVVDSYWDTQESGIADDGDTAMPEGEPTADLQSVTSATGIYNIWDGLTIDAIGTSDDAPWTFGTTNQYPVLKYADMDTTAQFDAQPRHYDTDSDGFIEVSSLAQLNVVRWDLDGDGAIDARASANDRTAYNAAFPDASVSKGCPATGCTGYELLSDLDFDENNDGAITSADATYWNSGNGWEPIGDDSGNNYTADFKGNGFTINNLLISRSGVTDVGLFGAISNTSRIESLGVIDGDVAAWKWVGILVGTMRGEVVACYTTGKVSATGTSSGGLVGYLYNGTISTSYSNASLSGESNTGGLVGARFGGSITNSYSTGRVSGTGSNVGGLIGNVVSPGSVSNSYWDTFLSYHNTSAGGTGYATADLQRPNDYIGIYSSWNANIDGQSGNDDPWTFGAMNQYPALKYAGMDTTVQFNLQPVVVTLALTPSSISENGGMSTVTATLARSLSAATTITVRPVTGAYTVGSDSTITIPAGQTANASDTVVITAVNNTQDEPNRDVTMSAVMHNSQVAGRVAGATLTITDDDLAPMVTLTPNPASISENGAVSTVMASLSRPSNEATTITVRPLAGAYEVSATDSTITIAAGDTINASDTVVITSVDNTRDEPNRVVDLSGVSRNAQGAGSVTGTITLTDDDDPPDVTMVVSPASISENGGISTVTATLSHTSSDPTTITVTVAPVSPAVAGDYTISTPATLTVAAGQTMSAGTVTITGVNNADATGNKTVTVSSTLTNSVGTGSVTDVTLTLVDDDVPNVTLVLSPASITENAQVSTITATLDRTATTAATVTVSAMAVSPAVAGDFTLSTTTTLTFAANVTTSTGTVTITSVNDTTDAPDKEVTVSATVTGGNMAVLSSSETLTITDDDPQPRLSISSPSAVEGTALTFTVRLNAVSGKAVTVAYADAGTGTATSGTDYTALTAGTLTFAAGTTSQTIAVSVSDDGDDEPNETVIVTLSSATNATISTAQGTGTIIDDDGMPALSIGSPSVIEGATGATLTFRVYLRPAHTAQVTVAYADAGTGTATSGTDYTALTAGTLTFAMGDTIQTIPVSVTDDSNDEQNETVIVTLSSATNATISTAQGTGTIIDDETPSANLDVDGDGRVRLFSDIILVIRYVLFFREEALLRGNVIEPTATRTTAQEIEPYLDTLVNQNILDVDGDGDVRLFSDIILIIRYVLFFRNEALLRGNVIEPTATRTTAQAIEPYIRSLYPASHFQ